MIATMILTCAALSAGNMSEFVQIAEAHQQLVRYDLTVEVDFPAAAAMAPLVATIRKADVHREMRTFGDLTILETSEWRIAVDSGDRVIVVGRKERPGGGDPARDVSPSVAIQQWIDRGATIAGGEVTEEGRRWRVEPAGGKGPRAEIVVDASTRLVRRVIYDMTDANGKAARVDIHYTWRDPSGIRTADFEAARFIVVEGDDIRPAKAFAGYRILRSDAK